MANTFLTGQTIASAAIVGLRKKNVLISTVFRDAETGFNGKTGDTVTVRVDALDGAARTYNTDRSAEIVMDDIAEVGVPVKLDTFLYKGVNVNDEDRTLKIENYNTQILDPLVRAVAGGAEELVVGALGSITGGVSGTAANVIDVILEAEGVLNTNDVPLEDRVLVVGANVRKALLKNEHLIRVDASGSDDALRRATIGDLFGMQVIYSNRVPNNVAYAYHKTAVAAAFKALDVPEGATYGASISYEGLSLRFIADYDPRFQRDRAVVSILAGASLVKDDNAVKRAVKITIS